MASTKKKEDDEFDPAAFIAAHKQVDAEPETAITADDLELNYASSAKSDDEFDPEAFIAAHRVSEEKPAYEQIPAEYVAELLRPTQRFLEAQPIVGPLAAKAGIGMHALTESAFGEGGDVGENYEKLTARKERGNVKFGKDHPALDLGLNVAGSMLPSPLSIIPGLSGAKGLGIAKRIGGLSIGSAADKAARDGTPQEILESGAMGGAFGAGGEVIGAVAPHIVPAMLGVKKATVDLYKQAPGRINAQNREEIVRGIKDAAKPFRENIEGAKAGVQKVKDYTKESLSRVKIARAGKLATASAEAGEITAELKKIKPPEALTADVAEAARILQKNISQKSGEAFRVLEKSGIPIPANELSGYVTEAAESLRRMGVENRLAPPTKLRHVQDMIQESAKLPAGNISDAVRAKDMIQLLDEAAADGWNAIAIGQRPSAEDSAIMALRRKIDERIKAIPGYAEAMKPVAEAMKLSNELTARFSKERGIETMLKGVHKNRFDQKVLADLGAQTGKDLLTPLRTYHTTQAILGSKPKLAEAISKIDKAADVPRLQKEFGKSLGKVANRGKKALIGAKETLATAQRDMDPLRGLAYEGADNFVSTAMGKRGRQNPLFQDRMRYLEEASGRPFGRDIDDLAVQEAFGPGAPKSSRNTLMFGAAGSGVGSWLAGPGGAVAGGSIGGLVGHQVDIHGPALQKMLLDISMSPIIAHIAEPLAMAVKKGPQSFAVTMNILKKQSKDFADFMENYNEE